MIRRFGNKVKKQWRRTPNKEIYYIKKSCKFKALQEAVDGEETLEAWSVQMKKILMTIGLWDIVEATTEPPAPEDEIAFNAWSKKNAMALYLIMESSSKFDDTDSVIAFDSTNHRTSKINFDFTNHRTAKIFWEILEEKLSKERG
uniref:Uncharacterized protein n=1 Tax=Quercus lobata TaxID=97700 RepID=A0A7N2LJL7_QUELO